MKKILPLIALLATQSYTNDITIVKQKSENFLLGKETHINMKFKAQDNPNMWLKAGVRIQGTFENVATTKGGVTSNLQDAYLRRVRFEVAAGFSKTSSFVMDVRNDKANKADKGEGKFNVGDAYVKIKNPFNTSLVNFKLYRAKIDISRTETVKSARVIVYDRPHVADYAAQFITENRRGTNAQMYGNWKKKIHYQFAIGDATATEKSKDATGKSLDGSIGDQNFFYGGKIRFSPFDGWEETSRTETYFAKGKHFSIGASYWNASKIAYIVDGKTEQTDHTLLNYEISAHYKNAFIQAEYFDFDGVSQKWGTDTFGQSTGWYVTGEYVVPELDYIAPFFRYESWDKFSDEKGYTLNSKLVGINWYLRGNTTKAGLIYQKDTYSNNVGNKEVESLRLTTQWFF